MKSQIEFEAEWSSYEWLLVADLERGDMEQFNHRLLRMRSALTTLGCSKNYVKQQMAERVEELHEYMSIRHGGFISNKNVRNGIGCT